MKWIAVGVGALVLGALVANESIALRQRRLVADAT